MPEIGVNKVILIGRTGPDAELKYTANGKAAHHRGMVSGDRGCKPG
jgi:single-stranded DNA-binding protein